MKKKSNEVHNMKQFNNRSKTYSAEDGSTLHKTETTDVDILNPQYRNEIQGWD